MAPSLMSQVKQFIVRSSSQLLSPFYSGIGCIVMLHRIADHMPVERVGWCKDLEVTGATLEDIVRLFRQHRYAFLSMDEVRDRLQGKGKSEAKFVAFTFDDGYRDVFTRGFPILRDAGVPFTLYLTTGYPDKTLLHWWYLLEDLLLAKTRLAYEREGVQHEFLLQSPAQREMAFDQISQQFEISSGESQQQLARLLFGAEASRAIIDQLSMSWEELLTMAAHPLVTIGAHTRNHPNLRKLPLEQARQEIWQSKQQIEQRLGKPVRHFAYPFGGLQHAAEREFALAQECGFDTATTTRLANIFPGNRASMFSLPRLYAAEPSDMEVQISGAVSAFRYRGRRVISI